MKAKFLCNLFIYLTALLIYPNLQAQNKVLTTNFGHTDEVNCVVFSPDGKMLASASFDNTIKLWNVKSGRRIRTLKGHNMEVSSVSFSPNGNILASASYDSTIKLWDVKSGQEIRTLKGHKWAVNSVSFRPDGKIIASGSNDNTIKLWDIESGLEIKTLKGHKQNATSVSFSPTGKMLASASWDSTIKLWDTESGQEIRTLKGHKWAVNSVSFSPNGKIIASGSNDNTIKLWDIENGQEIRTLKGHNDCIKSISFSPTGKVLVSGDTNSTIKLWNVKSGQEIRTLKRHNFWVSNISFSPNGKILASASWDGTTKLWDTKSGKVLATLVCMNESNNYDWIIYTPEGKYDGVNCSKYLHYVAGNKTYNLPSNDPNYAKNLLSKIFEKYNDNYITLKDLTPQESKPTPVTAQVLPQIILNHSDSLTTENNTFTISGKATGEKGILLVLVNDLRSDDGQDNFEYSVNLKEGENKFQILAIDNKTNRISKTVHITYKPKRKDIALLFYVSEYSNTQLSDLQGTKENAEQISAVLKNSYGFETHIFPNYNNNQIREVLEKYQKKTYSTDDQLLIYFSGHGSNRYGGMLLCANDSDIPHSQFRDLSAGNCNHIMLVVDACYSGLLYYTIGSVPPVYQPTRKEYLNELFEVKSARKLLTSGEGVGTIPDNGLSYFTEALIKVLKEKTGKNHNVLTDQELSGYLKIEYNDLKSGYFHKSDNSEARFLFIKKQ